MKKYIFLLLFSISFAQPSFKTGAIIGGITGAQLTYGNKINLVLNLGYYNLFKHKNSTRIFYDNSSLPVEYSYKSGAEISAYIYGNISLTQKLKLGLGAGLTQRFLSGFSAYYSSLEAQYDYSEIQKKLYWNIVQRLDYSLTDKYTLFAENNFLPMNSDKFSFGIFMKTINVEYLPNIGILRRF